MRKTLKMVALGMTMGVLGSMAFPVQEAQAQDSKPEPMVCCSSCNPVYQQCAIRAGSTQVALAACQMKRALCEVQCSRAC